MLILGPPILKMAVRSIYFLRPWEAKLFLSFLVLMLLAWLASFIHLAAIIGAFAAGVLLHDDYFDQVRNNPAPQTIKYIIAPLEALFAPIFFIMIGMQVKLETFFNIQVIILALGIIAAAIIGKLISGLGANRRDDRLFIGIGMLPRGEVGLVFAAIGRNLGVISDNLFSAMVLMVMVTTFIVPPLLKARFGRQHRKLNA